MTLLVSGSLGATFVGTLVPWFWHVRTSRELWQNLKESVFLTAKTTAMVCWLFVGSALFSGVFALHGGQGLIERWVLGMNLSPVGFLIISQLIIFLLGWPLEWTEIIVIFCPIFIPLLSHFQVDPILFGTMVAVNLQAAFLSPPVAMSAFYLKGVAPKHVTLNQIFAGMMPYMIIVCICLAFMYIWPGMTLWLPSFYTATSIVTISVASLRSQSSGILNVLRVRFGALLPRALGCSLATTRSNSNTLSERIHGADESAFAVRVGSGALDPRRRDQLGAIRRGLSRANSRGRWTSPGVGVSRSRPRAGAGTRSG